VIAFASMIGGNWQIYVMNADGSDQRRLTTGTRGGYEPSWAPEGGRLVFQNNGLWSASLSTGEISRIKLDAGSLENEYLTKPSWSPVGDWIAFNNESGYEGDIHLVRPDGSGLLRLTDSGDVSRDGNLAWSPDGMRLAFTANRDGNLEIFSVEVSDADRQVQLTDTLSPVRNLAASWSPDGSRIAFSSDRDGNMEIYLMDQGGSNVVRLTNHPASDIEPCWSPDGRYLVFSSNRDGDFEVDILDVEVAMNGAPDSAVRRLTDLPGNVAGPVWGLVP
jgi:TolB protein